MPMAALLMRDRRKIKPSNFAVKSKTQGHKYPIHDEKHARLALAMVRMHGTPHEKRQVYQAVAKKYPQLAMRSSVVPDKYIKKTAAGEVTDDEAARAYRKLKELKSSKLTAGELGRGALTGAIVGPAAAIAANLPRLGEFYRGGGVKGVFSGLAKGMIGASLSGAVLGAGLPSVRRRLDERAQITKLEDYLSKNRDPGLRRRFKRTMGL
jgi:hypothetical protein